MVIKPEGFHSSRTTCRFARIKVYHSHVSFFTEVIIQFFDEKNFFEYASICKFLITFFSFFKNKYIKVSEDKRLLIADRSSSKIF